MKGIIYKIECNETGEVYYGSTTLSLNKRISKHKTNCKRWKEGKCRFTTSFNIIDRGNYSYSLIETVECEDRGQLEARERFYIESNECINKMVVGRTWKERYEANKEAILEQQKEYKEANKDHISEYNKEYKQKNKERWNEYMREFREANKDHINERQRQRRAKAKLLKKTID
jgi:hypothetical protein